MKNRKTAVLGLFTAVAIIFGYVEMQIPVFVSIPGIKLGLANLSVLFILERYSFREAFLVSVIRIAVIGFMFGNLFSICYGLAGALLSLTVMSLLKTRTGASVFATSMAGGISHNIGQLLIAIPLARLQASQSRLLLATYAPALIISGIVTGYLIGWLTVEVMKRIRP